MAQAVSNYEIDADDVLEEAPLLDDEAESVEAGPSNAYSREVILCIFICVVLIVCFEIGFTLQVAPLNKVLESIICKNYFPELASLDLHAMADDQRCKSNDVQGTLATLRGWQLVTEILPGLLTTIFYGFLADKYGRKKILLVSVVGIILNFIAYAVICWFSNILSVWLTLVTPMVMFVGGGSVVATSLVFTVASDVAHESQRATTFFIIGAASLSGDLVAAPISSILMERNVWIPIVLGILIMVVGWFGILFLPETLHFRTGGKIPEDLETPSTTKDNTEHTILDRIKTTASQMVAAVSGYIWGDTKVALLMLTLLLTSLGRYAGELKLQYATKKFHWTWAQAGYLIFLKAVCSLVLLVVLLPSASHILTSKYSFTVKAKDLWLARVSSILALLGAFLIAFSPSSPIMVFGIIIFSIGSAYGLIVRSLLASMVEPHHIGTLFNTISLLQTAGSIIAGPLLANTFKLGLKLDGIWIGLPFMVAGCLLSFAAVVIWTITVTTKSVAGQEDVILDSDITQ
ncbi:hypothetical protein BP6252_01057 [Coleophoma cylindrospora]|uniref:Major facilitator superfamily (MFS) profile domain-containing protein n=1 Tax=Coleophoma cylindrospora TaxID=1849047 RepID=A0A3D8SRU3_9HELO|nr:hypothetical protein BP6252_01057 [Coleophoma cylindrospora]